MASNMPNRSKTIKTGIAINITINIKTMTRKKPTMSLFPMLISSAIIV